MIQHEWTLTILCYVKKASRKRPHNVWFCLYEMSTIGKSIETECWSDCTGQEEGWIGSMANLEG